MLKVIVQCPWVSSSVCLSHVSMLLTRIGHSRPRPSTGTSKPRPRTQNSEHVLKDSSRQRPRPRITTILYLWSILKQLNILSDSSPPFQLAYTKCSGISTDQSVIYWLFSATGRRRRKATRRTSGSVLQRNLGNNLCWLFHWHFRQGRLQSTRFRVCCCLEFVIKMLLELQATITLYYKRTFDVVEFNVVFVSSETEFACEL